MNLALIPLRSKSKTIPLKNIKEFCGKPLVYWTLKALENSDFIHTIFVASDSHEINEVVNSFKFSKVNIYDRDPKNSDDYASTESVMLEFIKNHSFDDDDLLFLVQATSPFTQTEDFKKALETYSAQKADSLLTCVRTNRFFWKQNGIPYNYDYKNRPRRQDYEGVLMENGAFYINSVGNIKRDQNRLGGKVAIHEMKAFTGIEIDEEDDWIVAEKLMRKYVLFKN